MRNVDRLFCSNCDQIWSVWFEEDKKEYLFCPSCKAIPPVLKYRIRMDKKQAIEEFVRLFNEGKVEDLRPDRLE